MNTLSRLLVRKPRRTPRGQFSTRCSSAAARERVLLAVVLLAVGVALLAFESSYSLRPGRAAVRGTASAADVCAATLRPGAIADPIDCPPADPTAPVRILTPLQTSAGSRDELLGLGAFALALFAAHLWLRRVRPQADPTLLPAAALLSGIGLVLSFRLGPDLAVHAAKAGFAQLGWRHLRFAAAGPLVAAAVAAVASEGALRWLARMRWVLLVASALTMLAMALVGVERHGVRLVIPLFGSAIQPVEFIKVGLVIALAGVLARQEDFLVRRRGRRGVGRLRPALLVPAVAGAAAVVLPIFVARELGPVAILGLAALGMVFCATGKLLPVGVGMGSVIGVGAACYRLGWPGIVRERVDLWLEPFLRNQTMAEAAWSLAAAGPWGVGLGRGLAYRVPEVQSDFTFTAWTEETGLVGAAVLLGALLLLVGAGLVTALRSRHPFHRLAAAGLSLLIAVQSAVILGGNVGLLPLTGVTLPFTSYGGSGLLANYAALGLLLAISHHARNALPATGRNR